MTAQAFPPALAFKLADLESRITKLERPIAARAWPEPRARISLERALQRLGVAVAEREASRKARGE